MSLEITKVNKFELNDWYAELLFTDFKVRAALKHTTDLVTRFESKRQLKRRLEREVGQEGQEWHLVSNTRNRRDELYLKNASRLMMWKLQNLERFEGLFDGIEQHEE